MEIADKDQIEISKSLVHHQLITEGDFKGCFILRPKAFVPFSLRTTKQINAELALIKKHGFLRIISSVVED